MNATEMRVQLAWSSGVAPMRGEALKRQGK